MALDPNLPISTLFGKNAVLTDTTLTIDLSDLGTFQGKLSGEGVLLALIQHLEKVQGTSTSRILEVRSTQTFANKGSDPVIGQMTSLRIFSAIPIDSIAPTSI